MNCDTTTVIAQVVKKSGWSSITPSIHNLSNLKISLKSNSLSFTTKNYNSFV